MSINSLFSELPLKHIKSITPFNKGWANDQKFIMLTENDGKYLLRITNIKNKKTYLEHADLLKQAAKNNVPTHHLTAHGACLNNTHYFLLLNWIEGNDAKEVISTFSESEQYAFGVEAGELLNQIHHFKPVTENNDSWHTRYNKKIDKNIKGKLMRNLIE